MKPACFLALQIGLTLLLVLGLATVPALAQEEHAAEPDPASTPLGFGFRWLNTALILSALIWVIRKFGGPLFRENARAISGAIREAADARALAERELAEVARQLENVDTEIRDLRRAGMQESEADAERLRALAQREAEKIARAAQAEIEAAERLAYQQLRNLAARMATERAASLVRQRLNPAAEKALFGSFLGELQRGAR
jgi:F0F1-type ATP synthase membrane subunit b/b'